MTKRIQPQAGRTDGMGWTEFQSHVPTLRPAIILPRLSIHASHRPPQKRKSHVNKMWDTTDFEICLARIFGPGFEAVPDPNFGWKRRGPQKHLKNDNVAETNNRIARITITSDKNHGRSLGQLVPVCPCRRMKHWTLFVSTLKKG